MMIHSGYLRCGHFLTSDDSDLDTKVNTKLRYIHHDYIHVLERVITDTKYNKIFVNNAKYLTIDT